MNSFFMHGNNASRTSRIKSPKKTTSLLITPKKAMVLGSQGRGEECKAGD